MPAVMMYFSPLNPFANQTIAWQQGFESYKTGAENPYYSHQLAKAFDDGCMEAAKEIAKGDVK
jgi:hypothetical protein